MSHDVTHCSDYDEKKCPLSCYKAELTKDLAEHHSEFIGVPLSYASFLGTNECARSYKPVTEEMKMLDQLEEVLTKCDKPEAEIRTPTMRSFLVLARIVYYLLSRRIKEKK